jgi:flagellin
MSIGIGGSNPAYSLQSILAAQEKLAVDVDELSSGSSLSNSAASSVAIYNNLTAQAQGADTANENISDAQNAVNVAQGAAQGIQTALSQINNLAIEANNGFNSPTDNQALQDEAGQLVQQINQDAGGVNFNGTTLLDGTQSGTVQATAAQATITNNDQTNSGGGVLTSATATGATTSGTFTTTIDSNGNADVTYTDSTTQQTTSVGTFAANSSTTYNGTTLNFGNFSSSDAGATATVQATAATAGSTNPNISVQSGPNAGQTINVNLPNATTAGLGITNIDLSNPASATNSEGQISNAITNLGLGQAQLGAESTSLGDAFDNNNILSNNLTASASAIGDTNYGQASSDYNSNLLQQQISVALLANANNNAGHLNAFLSTYA